VLKTPREGGEFTFLKKLGGDQLGKFGKGGGDEDRKMDGVAEMNLVHSFGWWCTIIFLKFKRTCEMGGQNFFEKYLWAGGVNI